MNYNRRTENFKCFVLELQFCQIIKAVYNDLEQYLRMRLDRFVRRALVEWYFMIQQDCNDPLLLDKETGMKHEANKKLIQTLENGHANVNSKGIPFDQYLWNSIGKARAKYSLECQPTPSVRWNSKDKQIQINHDKSIYHDHLAPLKEQFQCDEILLARVALIASNEMMNLSGFDSSEKPDVVKLLYSSYNVRFEGFASSLSCVLLTYADTNWCSMFEVDKQFGSMGNFFHLDLSKREHQGCWMLNPPFIESIIDDMAFKVLHSLRFDRVESCFFISIPIWSDMWAWKNLRNSRFLLDVMDDVPLVIEYAQYGHLKMVQSKERCRCFLILGHSKYARENFDDLREVLNSSGNE